jgi:hypothetical protein
VSSSFRCLAGLGLESGGVPLRLGHEWARPPYTRTGETEWSTRRTRRLCGELCGRALVAQSAVFNFLMEKAIKFQTFGDERDALRDAGIDSIKA